MNLEALIVLPQVSQAIRSRAVYAVRDRFTAPGFAHALALSAAAPRSTPVAPAPVRYTVQQGDFLTRIVRDQLEKLGRPAGNADVLDGMKRVAGANGISDPDLIHPGQQIDLSVLGTAASGAADAQKAQGGRSIPPVSGIAPARTHTRARLAAEERVVPAVAKSHTPANLGMPWAGVLDAEAEVSSPYGYRRDPFTGARRFHHGVDLAVPSGTPVHPLRGGEVTFSGWKAGYGRVVVVRHDDGVESLYGHASRTLVKTGDVVGPDDTLALSGSSGRSTGPHLHLEVRRNGRAFDPSRYPAGEPIRLASNR